MVDVAVNDLGGASAIGMTIEASVVDFAARDRARYEREIAALDLTDAAQAMTRAHRGRGGGPVDHALADLACTLYVSADHHRLLAERIESGIGERP